MVGKAATIGFVFPLMAGRLRRLVLSLRQRQGVFDDWFYLSANSIVSPTIVLVSPLTAERLRQLSLSLRQRQDVRGHCLNLVDHSSYASDHGLRV